VAVPPSVTQAPVSATVAVPPSPITPQLPPPLPPAASVTQVPVSATVAVPPSPITPQLPPPLVNTPTQSVAVQPYDELITKLQTCKQLIEKYEQTAKL
jgi:hypothetical protein